MGILVRNNKVISAGGKILYRSVGNPFELPNLKLYLSATRMVQQADESSVSSFTDFSGNGFHATQGTSGFQPKFDLNQFGGATQSGIKFDADDYLSTSNTLFKNINQFTFLCVIKRANISASIGGVFTSYITNYTNFAYRFNIYTINSLCYISYRVLDTNSQQTLSFTLDNLNPTMIAVTLNSADSTLRVYKDGTFQTAIIVPSGFSTNTNASFTEVGVIRAASPNTTAYINGIVVTHSYSSPEVIQAQYRGYLQRGFL